MILPSSEIQAELNDLLTRRIDGGGCGSVTLEDRVMAHERWLDDFVRELNARLDAHFAPQAAPPQDAEAPDPVAMVDYLIGAVSAGENVKDPRTALLTYIAGLRRAREGEAELSRDLTAQAVIAEANGHAAAAVLFRRAAEALGGKL